MAKYKKTKNTSVKEVDVIDEVETEEELDEEEFDEVEEVLEDDEDFEDDETFEEESDEYEEIGLEERLANIEKRTNVTFYMVIAILVVVCLSLVISLTNNGNKENEDTTGSSATQQQQQSSTGYDTSAFNAIKPADIETLSKNKTIVVWIGYQECSFCQAYAPLLTQVTKEYGITANYIDITTVTESEFNIVTSLTGKGDWAEFAASFSGTPFTLIIKNNKVIGGINGYTEAENIAAAFEDAGIKSK